MKLTQEQTNSIVDTIYEKSKKDKEMCKKTIFNDPLIASQAEHVMSIISQLDAATRDLLDIEYVTYGYVVDQLATKEIDRLEDNYKTKQEIRREVVYNAMRKDITSVEELTNSITYKHEK